MATPHAAELARLGVSAFDAEHVLHPYTPMDRPSALDTNLVTPAIRLVRRAEGCRLWLADPNVPEAGEVECVDGTSSWWCAAHGYRVASIETALTSRIQNSFSHVMFGGLTHAPAAELTARLLDLVPKSDIPERALAKVFYSDSGSVAVEIALKMALQYHHDESADPATKKRDKFVTFKKGYHGDTFGAMAVCDPDGMHAAFSTALRAQVFVSSPDCYGNSCTSETCFCPTGSELERLLESDPTIAAFIVEPIFQGASAMAFHSPALLRRAREICTSTGVLMILDEIATGFGRLGTMFACEQAGILPDIMCVGKALTGGYLSLAATLCSEAVARGVSRGGKVPFMHGPTYMGNPLACVAGMASLDLFLRPDSAWKRSAENVETRMRSGLAPLRELQSVRRVECKGAVAVVELAESLPPSVNEALKAHFIHQEGVWLRPFARFIYLMPPFNAPSFGDAEIDRLAGAVVRGVRTIVEAREAARKRRKPSEAEEPGATYV